MSKKPASSPAAREFDSLRGKSTNSPSTRNSTAAAVDPKDAPSQDMAWSSGSDRPNQPRQAEKRSAKGSEEQTSDRPDESELGDIAAVAKEALQATVSAVSTQAAELTSNIAEELDHVVSAQKDRGADAMAGFAKAMRTAAEELREQSPKVAGGVRRAAKSVETLAGNLQGESVADLLRTASDFARRQPAGFFAGAIIAGFALSRFLKSHQEPMSSAPATKPFAGSFSREEA